VVLVADGSLIPINRHHTNHNKSRGKYSTAFLFWISGETILNYTIPWPGQDTNRIDSGNFTPVKIASGNMLSVHKKR
jgi:hypothetical protein